MELRRPPVVIATVRSGWGRGHVIHGRGSLKFQTSIIHGEERGRERQRQTDRQETHLQCCCTTIKGEKIKKNIPAIKDTLPLHFADFKKKKIITSETDRRREGVRERDRDEQRQMYNKCTLSSWGFMRDICLMVQNDWLYTWDCFSRQVTRKVLINCLISWAGLKTRFRAQRCFGPLVLNV